MKRSDLNASIVTLMYGISKFEIVSSLLVMFAVALFSYFFASDSVAGAQAGSSLTTDIWHHGGRWIRAFLGDVQFREFSRVVGCVCAGFAAAVFFVFIRHFLFYFAGGLRMIEYYRIHLRLLFWTVCVVLSFALSQFFIDLFVPVTLGAVNVVLACLIVCMTLFFLRVKRPVFLCAAFVLLGVLTSVSIIGVVMLMIATMILFIASADYRKSSAQYTSGYGYGHEYSYGGGYGSHGVSQYGYGASDTPTYGAVQMNEFDWVADSLLAERFHLLLLLCLVVGFVATLALVFGYGVYSGLGARDVVLQWLSWFGVELKGVWVSGELMVLTCCVMISFLFVNYRFARMFDVEYYLKVKDFFRLGSGFLLACAVLICIGRRFSFAADACLCGIPLLPLAIQVVAGGVMLQVVAVFLVNLKCRKISSETETADGTNVARQYNGMKVLLLLFFDLLPVFLLAAAIGCFWRD